MIDFILRPFASWKADCPNTNCRPLSQALTAALQHTKFISMVDSTMPAAMQCSLWNKQKQTINANLGGSSSEGTQQLDGLEWKILLNGWFGGSTILGKLHMRSTASFVPQSIYCCSHCSLFLPRCCSSNAGLLSSSHLARRHLWQSHTPPHPKHARMVRAWTTTCWLVMTRHLPIPGRASALTLSICIWRSNSSATCHSPPISHALIKEL